MMRGICFLPLLTLFCPLLSQGQTTRVTGTVRDSTGAPILLASIVAGHCCESRTLAYTSTDENGAFALTLSAHDCDTITLTVRALGYQTLTQRRLVQETAPLDLRLGGSVLREVVVRAEAPPVVLRSDTTEFRAASFSDSTEFSVEDLLKKIPGVRVNENGLISYNGKTVERVLIEGDDLFSLNYPLATRNIRADMVDKIQAIDRFQENPLLKGVSESDRMVFNLTIREEKKRSTSGSLTGGLGGGGGTRGKLHANLFSLTRRDKTYLIGNVNNTAENTLGSVQMLQMGDYFDRNRQVLQNNPLQAESLLGLNMFQSLGLPMGFTQNNESGLVYAGHVMPLSERFKIKLSGWYGGETLEQHISRRNLYLLDGNTLDLQEQEQHRRLSTSRLLQAEIEYFAPSGRQSLRSFLKVTDNPLSDRLHLTRTSAPGSTLNVQELQDTRPLDAFGVLEYSFKPDDGQVVQVAAKLALHRNPHDLQAGYPAYSPFFGLDTSYRFLLQTTDLQQDKIQVTARYLFRFAGLKWQLECGSDMDWGRVHTGLVVRNDTGGEWTGDDAFRNDLALRSSGYFARAHASQKAGNWLFQAWLQPTFLDIDLNDPLLTTQSRQFWLTESGAFIQHEFSPQSRIGLRYGYRPSVSGLSAVYPGFVFSGYESLGRALPEIISMPTHSARLYSRHENPRTHYGWNTSVSVARADNTLGTQYAIDPYLFVQEQYRPVSQTTLFADLSVFRFFPALSSRFEIGISANAMRTAGRVNGLDERVFDNRQYGFLFRYGSAFEGWVNVLLSAQWTQGLTLNQRDLGASDFRTGNWFSSAQITVKPNSRVYLKLDFFQVGNQIEKQDYQFFYGLQGTFSWQIPAWRSALSLTGMNLLGAGSFERSSAGAFFQNSTAVRAVRPFGVLAWDFRF